MLLGRAGRGFGDGLAVRVAFGDVVGADVEEEGAAGFAGLGHFADGDDVSTKGGGGLGFAQVDIMKGGGVDDGVWAVLVEHGGEGGGVADVELGAAGEGEDFVAAPGEDAGEVETQLAGGADDGDAHKPNLTL